MINIDSCICLTNAELLKFSYKNIYIHYFIQKNYLISHSNNVNATIEYILEVHSISPPYGSLMGGTRITLSGSGFSNRIPDNKVSFGE